MIRASLIAYAVVACGLPIVRAIGVVHWRWLWCFTPLALGVIAFAAATIFIGRAFEP